MFTRTPGRSSGAPLVARICDETSSDIILITWPIWCQITGMDKNSITLGWRQAVKRLDGAYSSPTMKSYRVNVEKFVSWCNARGYEALPASVETVSEFLNGQSLNATTVKRVIKKAAGLSGFDESDVSDFRAFNARRHRAGLAVRGL